MDGWQDMAPWFVAGLLSGYCFVVYWFNFRK